MITITLPGRPVSVNHLYGRTMTGRVYITKEGASSKSFWQIHAKQQFKRQRGEIFKEDNLKVTVRYFFENKARRDVDNYLKALLDCLTGVVWDDDRQVMELSVVKGYAPKGEQPRTELEVSEIII